MWDKRLEENKNAIPEKGRAFGYPFCVAMGLRGGLSHIKEFTDNMQFEWWSMKSNHGFVFSRYGQWWNGELDGWRCSYELKLEGWE